jgi:hypothetical protein
MMSAESNVTVPSGKRDLSSKKVEWTASTSSGRTCHCPHRSSTPSQRPPLRVAEYPSGACSKKADASAIDEKTDPGGQPRARCAVAETAAVPSWLAKETSFPRR